MTAPLAAAWLAALAVVLGCGGSPDAVVFAAASTADVAQAVADRVGAETGRTVAVSVGASSALARQVAAGAPADVYLTADPAWADWLADRGVEATPRRVVAGGRLVVVGPADTAASGARDALSGRVALADPSHVPAGRYARRALEAAGLWDDVAPRVVATGDVRGALAAVQTGAADRAVVYASDVAAAGGVGVVWRFAASPDVQFLAARLPGGPGDRALADRVYAELARPEVWAAAGFEPAR